MIIQLLHSYADRFEYAIDLTGIYTKKELDAFNHRWEQFYAADVTHPDVIKRHGNTISYIHKSWIPHKVDKRTPLLLLFGNSAPHSVKEDIYFAYEGNGTEHRFWRVMRELGYIDMKMNSKTIKKDFFDLKYDSPFRLGMEVLYTFPSPPSDPKWSGVAGMERLFGRKVMRVMFEQEKKRMESIVRIFLQNGGAVVAFQKDAYNALSQESYSLKKAVEGQLSSMFDDKIKVYGTAPTRWLYTQKMKKVLAHIKNTASG